MKTLREGELTINLPEPEDYRPVDLEAAGRAILCAPGCLAVEVDPPRESHGGVWLPDSVQGRLRADCGTVVACGEGPASRVRVRGARDAKEFGSSDESGSSDLSAGSNGPDKSDRALRPGDRVLLRPYHGLWIEPFESMEPAFAPVEAREWQAHGKSVAIKVDQPPAWRDLAQPDRLEGSMMSIGRVVSAGSEAWPVMGSRVVFSNFHPRTAHMGLDSFEPGVVIVEDRQVFATLGPSSYRAGMVRFYGAGTDWWKSVLMVARAGSEGAVKSQISNRKSPSLCWMPLAPWVLIEREMSVAGGLHLPEVAAARMRMRARVVAGGGQGLESANLHAVLVDPNPAEAIGFEMGGVGRERQLVPESAVWAVLECAD